MIGGPTIVIDGMVMGPMYPPLRKVCLGMVVPGVVMVGTVALNVLSRGMLTA